MAPRAKSQPEIADTPEVEEAPVVVVRAFKLVDGLLDEAGEPVNRITFGCSPRVSVGTGETFSTDNPALAERLAADSDFEETNA